MLHLEHLVRDPAFGLAVGERGRAFAAPQHTAAAYVDALEPFMESCIKSRPVCDAQHALVHTLAEFGLSRTDPAAERAVALLASMTDRKIEGTRC